MYRARLTPVVQFPSQLSAADKQKLDHLLANPSEIPDSDLHPSAKKVLLALVARNEAAARLQEVRRRARGVEILKQELARLGIDL